MIVGGQTGCNTVNEVQRLDAFYNIVVDQKQYLLANEKTEKTEEYSKNEDNVEDKIKTKDSVVKKEIIDDGNEVNGINKEVPS